jgi:hypothetical protein
MTTADSSIARKAELTAGIKHKMPTCPCERRALADLSQFFCQVLQKCLLAAAHITTEPPRKGQRNQRKAADPLDSSI